MDTSTDTITTNLGNVINDTYNYANNLLLNPAVLFALLIIIVLYVVIFMSLGNSNEQINTSFSITEEASKISGSSSNVMIGLIVLFIFLIIVNGLQYFFGMDITAKVKNLISGDTEVDINVDMSRSQALQEPVPEILFEKQVFNIPGNDYVYPDAKAICSAYGARLATYSEIEDSYKNGGEWCNYGWSDGQMALFPTQKKTFDNLQKIEGHENDCGRPGVNGGYMSNPALKFGVNCYGYKPRMTSTEENLMETEPIYPKTKKDIAMENRVSYWKDKLSTVLVSPFNHTSWSRL